MATFSKKMGGKEVGNAAVYAKPHNMNGKATGISEVTGPSNKQYMKDANVSVANTHSNDYPAPKTTGIKMRGTGAATKGLMSRGPMA
jgi:hypothetical protein